MEKKAIDNKRLKNLKLIVFDLDGTLLNDVGEIGSETKKIIRELKNLGVQFSFASGRLHTALADYAHELEINTPLISLDGALLRSVDAGKIYFQSFVPVKHVQKAVALSERLMLKIALCHADAIYYTELNDVIPDLIDKFGAKFEEIHNYGGVIANTLEIVMISDFKNNVKMAEKYLSFPYSFGLTTTYSKSHANEGIYFLEVRKNGSTKGTGLKKLTKHLRIKIQDTAVMGDWYNDKALFETKALKIATGNAVPELRFLADHILTKTNNEDCAAEFLELVLRAKK